jgi:hypothetical protein
MWDITGALMALVLIQCVHLREQLEQVVLNPDVPDSITWHWTMTGIYSAISAYKMMLYGQTQLVGAKQLWHAKALAEFKFHLWLALQDRCWTTDRRHCRGLSDDGTCTLCSQCDETIDHLTLAVSSSEKCGFAVLSCISCQHLVPDPDSTIADWWLRSRVRLTKPRKAAFDSVVLLVVRHI